MRILKNNIKIVLLVLLSFGFVNDVLSQQFDYYECPVYEEEVYERFEYRAERLLIRDSLEQNRIDAGFNSLQPKDLTLVTDPQTCFAIRYPGVEGSEDVDFDAPGDGYYYGLYESTDFYFVFPIRPVVRLGITPIIVMDKSFELVAVWPL